jgi:hypothetical protein
MAIYNASLLISASNATYFTNVTGGIAAVAVRGFNDTWISSSALLTGSNTFVGNQIISGNVDINGTITASLQTGYLYVGNGSGKTQAVATSSIIANTDTGSLLVTGSVSGNTLTFTKGDASTFNLSVETGSTANINTGSFATTGSNVFKGTQFLYSTDGAAPLQISSSAYYGIQLQNQGIQIQGSGGPRIQFPNATWLNGNENDAFQFTGDTDNPLTRGIDFYLYGSGSRPMRFINNSGPGASIQFSSNSGSITFTANNNNMSFNAGGFVEITGSSTRINGLQYPQTDGTNGQAIITNGSGLLSFGNVSINTGSFMVTGSVAGNVLTFTKGDASTFSLTVDTGSGGGGVTGSFATLGANTFTGSQTINATAGALIFSQTGSGGSGIQFPNSKIYQNNFLNFEGLGIGVDFSVAGTNPSTNINFRNTSPSGQIQFTSDSSSISLRAPLSNVSLTGSGVLLQGLRYPNTDGTSGQVITTNGSGVLSFTTISGGVTGSFATLGANTFTGSQTIQSGSIINFLGSGPGQTGFQFGGGASAVYYATGGTNVLSIANANAGIDVQVNNTAATGSYLSFVNAAPNGNTNFSAQSGSVTVRSGNTFSIGRQVGGVGEVYMLGYSGSLVLGNQTVTNTYDALSHISSSQTNANTNLIFKTNSATGTTILSGSGNIFTNPGTPQAGYIRYIGGANNLYLNNGNGVNSQITASATSVSGVRPIMNNNIFQGPSNFTINQAVNSGTHTYSNNIINGTTTINALAFTGSLSFSNNLSSNGTITLSPASASSAEIALGLSGSGTMVAINNAVFGGQLSSISPRIMSTAVTQNMNNNAVFGGQVVVNNISSSQPVNANANFATAFIQYSNSLATAVHTSVGNLNTNFGGITINAIGSAVAAAQNIGAGAAIINNFAFSGSNGGGVLNINRMITQGQGHLLVVTGSTDAGQVIGNFSDNAILGKANTVFSNQTGQGSFNAFNGNVVGGYQLIVSASNSFVDLSTQGGGYFGRWNANDGIRNKTGETIFSVGTGTSTNRKTGFLIDSGSNTFVEGSLNVSGSTTMTGSLILSSSAAIELQVIGNTEMTGSLLVSSFTTLASVSSSLNFADDTAAAAGGVPLGGLYRNGNFVMIRLT